MVFYFQEYHDTLAMESERLIVSEIQQAYAASNGQTSRKGRPKKNITREQIELFLGHDFHVTTIADLLQVSRQIIHNRMR